MSDRGKTVLVVEDDEASREILLSVVEEIVGARAVGAEDGEVALRRVAELRPDLMLLDLRLPRLDGWQVLKRVKEDAATSAIPVVIISTASLPADRQRARESRADDFLEKPFDLTELEDKVRHFLHEDAEGGESASAKRW